jgi:hypothetical protein
VTSTRKKHTAPKEETMDDRVLALGPDERKLLAIFARYGRDGRAITTASLMAHAGFGLDRKRLSEALRKLAGNGLITQGGDDPFIDSPVAYRLVRPFPAEEQQGTRR